MVDAKSRSMKEIEHEANGCGPAGPRVYFGRTASGHGRREPRHPTPSNSRWRSILKDQVKADKNCDLAEVLTYSELKIGDEVAISGKVSCVDGREYDYNRPRPHQKFEFRLCEPSVC